MEDLKIAIIGAGPAGCMLARLLHIAGVPVTIFEGDKGLDHRSQGGTLDLHTDTGIKAVKRAGLYSEFLKHARFDGEALTLADKNLVKYVKMSGTKEGSSRGRPEIDRSRLREMLVQSLPDGCIVWGKRLKSVESDLTLRFEDGAETGFDLIVGADGGFSKVRPLLSTEELIYPGVGVVQGVVDDAKVSHPELYKLVNRGSLFTLSDHKVITAQQLGDGSLNVGAWSHQKERPTERFAAGEATEAAKDWIRKDFHDWSPQLLDFLLQSTDGSMVYRPMYMLPVGNSWEHRPGVTLLGDAAHLMTPFAGEGVNVALTDAMALADAILKTAETCKAQASGSSGSSDGNDRADVKAILSQNIREFESDMFKRVKVVQQLTYDMMQAMMFISGPPRRVVRTWLLGVLGSDVPRILYPLVVVAVFVYFFIHRLLLPFFR